MKELIINNWDKIVFLITLLLGIYQFFKTKKAEVEIEKLKSKLELEKDKNLLNDQKFRDSYQKFLNLIFDNIEENRGYQLSKSEKGINDYMKNFLLYSGPEMIKTFGKYRKDCGTEINVLLQMESVLFSMRKDLGVSNEGLEEYDILQTLVMGDIKEEIEKFDKIISKKSIE